MREALADAGLFTFHNVSINSGKDAAQIISRIKFTFHNVSINSQKKAGLILRNLYLHSIMYLLIL